MMLKVVDGERKRGPWIGVCLWLLLPMMASCQTGGSRNLEALVPPEAFTAENWYQVENPNPKQIIRIHGRAPDTLDIFITEMHEAANTADDRCWRSARHFGNELLWSRRRLPIRRDGDRYEVELVVDKFLPGPCDWRYTGSAAGVTRAGHPDDVSEGGGWVISTTRYGVDDSVTRCEKSLAPRRVPCPEERIWRESNHDKIAVEMPCRIRDVRDETAIFVCQVRRTGDYKGQHLLKPETSEIEINFYDLDNDSDVIRAQFKEAEGL